MSTVGSIRMEVTPERVQRGADVSRNPAPSRDDSS